MIKDNQKVFNRLLVIIDALITAVSFVLAYYIKFYILNVVRLIFYGDWLIPC